MASISMNAPLNYFYLLKKFTRFLDTDEDAKNNGNKYVVNVSVVSCS